MDKKIMIAAAVGAVVVVLAVVLMMSAPSGAKAGTGDNTGGTATPQCRATVGTSSQAPQHPHEWCDNNDYTKEFCNPAGQCHKHKINLAQNLAEAAGAGPHTHQLSGTAPADNGRLAETCTDDSTGKSMAITEALQIANAGDCAQSGTLSASRFCNSGTGTWWIDLTPSESHPGCNPACVVNVNTKKAEINWRCTGLLPPV